jgi:glycosyltransferase involved in cell wall biosynthesis
MAPRSGTKSKTDSRPRSPIKSPQSGSAGAIRYIIAILVAGAAYAAYVLFSAQRSVDVPVTATPTVSIIMIAHNENHYLERTFDTIMNNSPLEHLLEIVFVDDASDPPAATILDSMKNARIKIIRNEERQGLIRSKTAGARAAQGDILVFLDAHIRAYPGWLEPMIQLTSENYRRVVVPTIPVLNGTTWEQINNYVGIKLIFDWKMDFIWYVDDPPKGGDRVDYIPVMSGGLLAITRKWFFETGEYDMGMLQWGGENVEQSVKIWLCGGEIVVARSSRVGHVFRDVSPYQINVTQIHVNKARAIDVWFDEWASYYYRANPFDKDRRSSAESLAPRFEIRDRLKCKPFSSFVDKFRDVFIREKLLPTEVYGLRHKKTGLCMKLNPDGLVKGTTCDPQDRSQIFIPESWDRLRSGQFTDDCLEEKVPLGVGLCSAHVPEQKEWTLEPSGLLKRTPENSRGKCVTMDADGNMAISSSCQPIDAFEKFNPAPYSHDLYK